MNLSEKNLLGLIYTFLISRLRWGLGVCGNVSAVVVVGLRFSPRLRFAGLHRHMIRDLRFCGFHIVKKLRMQLKLLKSRHSKVLLGNGDLSKYARIAAISCSKANAVNLRLSRRVSECRRWLWVGCCCCCCGTAEACTPTCRRDVTRKTSLSSAGWPGGRRTLCSPRAAAILPRAGPPLQMTGDVVDNR